MLHYAGGGDAAVLVCLPGNAEFLASVLKGVNVGTWRFAADHDLVDWDEVTGSLLGMSAAKGLSFSDIPIYPDDVDIVAESLANCLASGQAHNVEFRVVFPSGEVRWVHAFGHLLNHHLAPIRCICGIVSDITERKRAELKMAENQRQLQAVVADLMQSEAVNRSILLASADCIKIITLAGDIELFNEPGVKAMELPSAEAVIGRRWADLWPESSRHLVRKALGEAARGEPSRFTGFCPTAKGAQKWWDVVVTPMEHDGVVTRLLAISRDITTHRNTTQELRWSSEHDVLTGLPNRRAFEIKLQAATMAAMASGNNLGLLLIDLDHFKHVNDTLGHKAGDFLLTNFAERLAASVRDSDLVARLGGDEFAVILPNVRGEADLVRTGDSILKRIQSPVLYEGRTLSARASIGGAVYPRDAACSNELFKHADTALFALKADGRGGTRMFQKSMCDRMETVATQINFAHSAIRSDIIRPHYQPKVCLRSGEIRGFEALLRVEQPGGAPHLPATIAEAFKEYELASQLGERMQAAVLADIAAWISQGVSFGRVSINAAPAEFLRDDYAERLLDMIAKFSLSPERLEVEVTEQVFIERGGEFVTRALRKLHAVGIRISLDDFGTGYSSLSHLRDYPVDVVKVDRSFVEHITTRADMAAIVRAVSSLCGSLGLQVVAEGVETPEQAARLAGKGCTFGQGYLFGRPVPADEVAGLLVDRSAKAWLPVFSTR